MVGYDRINPFAIVCDEALMEATKQYSVLPFEIRGLLLQHTCSTQIQTLAFDRRSCRKQQGCCRSATHGFGNMGELEAGGKGRSYVRQFEREQRSSGVG